MGAADDAAARLTWAAEHLMINELTVVEVEAREVVEGIKVAGDTFASLVARAQTFHDDIYADLIEATEMHEALMVEAAKLRSGGS